MGGEKGNSFTGSLTADVLDDISLVEPEPLLVAPFLVPLPPSYGLYVAGTLHPDFTLGGCVEEHRIGLERCAHSVMPA